MGVPPLGWVGDLRPVVAVRPGGGASGRVGGECTVSVDLSEVEDVAGVGVNFVEGGWLEVTAAGHDGLRLKLPAGVSDAECAVKLSRKRRALAVSFPVGPGADADALAPQGHAWRTRDSLAEPEARGAGARGGDHRGHGGDGGGGGGGSSSRGEGEEDDGFEVVVEGRPRAAPAVAPGFLARSPGALSTRRDGSAGAEASAREGKGVAAPAPIAGVVVASGGPPLAAGALMGGGARPRALRGAPEGLRVAVPPPPLPPPGSGGGSAKKQAKLARRRARGQAGPGGAGGGGRPGDLGEDGGGEARVGELADACAEMLDARGWAAVDGFAGADAVDGIRREIESLRPLYTAGEIGVGVAAEGMVQIARSDVRGDQVLWVDYDSMDLLRLANLKRLSRGMDALVAALAGRVARLAGVDVALKSDCMLAVYPGGKSRFQRHVDNTAGDGRRLTVLVYLNGRDWQRGHGGALRVHPEGTPRPVDLYPEGGRLAMFYADQVPHEVRPTDEERHALTVWYYDADEKRRAAEPRDGPEIAGVNLQRNTKLLTPTEERSVRVFTEVLMGGRSSGPQLLGMLDKSLTPRAAEAVCVILGVRSVDDLRRAFSTMDSDQTQALLSRLETMGLDDGDSDGQGESPLG